MSLSLPHHDSNQPSTIVKTASDDRQSLHWSTPARLMAGLLSLLFRSASEVTRIAGEIHGIVHQSPAIITQNVNPDLTVAPKLYQLIHRAFVQAANHVQKANVFLPTQETINQDLRRLQSVMNGVFGDKLADWGHSGAITMECLDENHQPIALHDLQARHPKGVALFVHGLCLSEYDWCGYQAQLFAKQLQEQGIGIARLRYNTGLTLSENGECLSQLLAHQWHLNAAQSLIMIGHSMGGLVIRSALHHGRDIHRQDWVVNVSHAVYVASPHEGANLEKLGNFANNLLGYSPYTKPLMSLGNIRSRGIRSLRDSNIRHELAERNDQALFHDQVHHLLIGARLPDPRAKAVLGDGLVTDHSAMGSSHFPEEHHKVTRLILDEVGHMKVINDPRLYQSLATWLERTPAH